MKGFPGRVDLRPQLAAFAFQFAQFFLRFVLLVFRLGEPGVRQLGIKQPQLERAGGGGITRLLACRSPFEQDARGQVLGARAHHGSQFCPHPRGGDRGGGIPLQIGLEGGEGLHRAREFPRAQRSRQPGDVGEGFRAEDRMPRQRLPLAVQRQIGQRGGGSGGHQQHRALRRQRRRQQHQFLASAGQGAVRLDPAAHRQCLRQREIFHHRLHQQRHGQTVWQPRSRRTVGERARHAQHVIRRPAAQGPDRLHARHGRRAITSTVALQRDRRGGAVTRRQRRGKPLESQIRLRHVQPRDEL